jgi:hypothetical protein
MALAFGLQGAGFTPTELSTEAALTLEPEGQGFRRKGNGNFAAKAQSWCCNGIWTIR